MPVAVVYRPPAITAEQYRASWSQGTPVAVPDGLLFHAGIGEGEQFFTVTVWRDRETYYAFVPKFKQAMNEQGLVFGEPVILDVLHYIKP
ncbi:MAG TPA: hypothetical protein VN577_23485 [Terriglobales bacterium]|nr:hypothetical protein [Terriglobales bacterium]